MPQPNKATWICLWPWVVWLNAVYDVAALLYKPILKYSWADYQDLSYQK